MPVQDQKAYADAKYRIVIQEDIKLKHNYFGLFNKGLLRHGVYIKHFPLLDWHSEHSVQMLKRENRGKVTATIVDVVLRPDYNG